MEITFTTPKNIVVVPETKKSFSKLTVMELIDNPSTKTVVARIQEIGRVTLWQGAAYDSIGQWTDTDVANRIKALYN